MQQNVKETTNKGGKDANGMAPKNVDSLTNRAMVGMMLTTALVTVLIIGIVLVVLVIFGFIKFTTPNQKVISITNVCSDDDIKQANDVYQKIGDATLDVAKLGELVEQIETRPGYDTDYTCLSIIAQSAEMSADYNKMLTIADTITNFVKQHPDNMYVSAKLYYRPHPDNIRRDAIILKESIEQMGGNSNTGEID